MTNPSANQNRPPRPGVCRYFACASWVWLVLRAREVAAAKTAGQVSLASSLDMESLASEWVPPPMQAVLSAPATQAIPFARPT